jgi:hypothetical protein
VALNRIERRAEDDERLEIGERFVESIRTALRDVKMHLVGAEWHGQRSARSANADYFRFTAATADVKSDRVLIVRHPMHRNSRAGVTAARGPAPEMEAFCQLLVARSVKLASITGVAREMGRVE